MTLRMTLEIVPYGVEEDKYDIMTLDISNTGTVKNEGFGNIYCSYEYSFKDHSGEVLKSGNIIEHNRRDGAVELVRKVLVENEEVSL